jgi:hypothetical protein
MCVPSEFIPIRYLGDVLGSLDRKKFERPFSYWANRFSKVGKLYQIGLNSQPSSKEGH